MSGDEESNYAPKNRIKDYFQLVDEPIKKEPELVTENEPTGFYPLYLDLKPPYLLQICLESIEELGE